MGDNRNIKRIIEAMVTHKTKLVILGGILICAIVVSAVVLPNLKHSESETITQEKQEPQEVKEDKKEKESDDKVSGEGLVVADPEDGEQEIEDNTVSFIDPEKNSSDSKDTEKDKGNNNQNDSSNNKDETSGGEEKPSDGTETPSDEAGFGALF